ncbi:hypothetical protein M231_05422 [Tremella mesenterica]|uniref:Inositol polyphosphate-related phosphatase domain-containing protein n=1 Tax=Tremella mesenterica TaxID=5217 RepID=A0A4Q1BI39_TREME|nr:hypothetical protein M231_05422 [Tremella mesenterica]
MRLMKKQHITLNLNTPEDKYELRISASLTVVVQNLLVELRRLSEVARTSLTPASLRHKWTFLYPVTPPIPPEEDSEQPQPSASTSSLTSPSDSSTSGQTPDTVPTSAEQSEKDEEHPNPFAEGFSRTVFLRKRLFIRESEWSSRTSLRVRIATYNVNDRLPPKGSKELSPLVGKGSEDILVFGLQEVGDLRSQALFMSQGVDRAQAWEEAIMVALGDVAGEFERLALTQYVGVVMIILVRRTLRPEISRLQTSERGIGLLGFGGNKAGVAVRFKVYDSTLCFVNSHLAAFANALERRRMDYETLCRGLLFPRPDDDLEEFWLGDLNYRVDLDQQQLSSCIVERRWQDMLQGDQLLADIENGKSFTGYYEAKIDFPPTFKYVHASTTLDTRRAPAYTDRILWTLPPALSITGTACSSYSSHDILWSDHRPVCGTYTTAVRVVDEVKRHQTLLTIQRELDKLEEIYRPILDVSPGGLDFGQVLYGRASLRQLTLRNSGKVPSTFSFKGPAPDKPICKPFLWPFPSHGVVPAGQERVVQVVMYVDEDWALRFTGNDNEMKDVLVFGVVDGKNPFITMEANFAPTVIGMPLHVLPLLPESTRSMSRAQRQAVSTLRGGLPQDEKKTGVKPARPLWILLEYLMDHPAESDWIGEVSLSKLLDIIDPVPENSGSIVCAALLHILACLPTPLIPLIHQPICLKSSDRDEAFASLEGLEQVNTNVLIGLMSVVRLCLTPKGDEGGIEAPAAMEIIDPRLVDVLCPAVFGIAALTTQLDERRRFIRILLEG